MDNSKRTRFGSQLLMYSNTTNENVADWFDGNIIFEMDLEAHEFDAVADDDLILMTSLVSKFFGNYKKLTVVVNYNEEGLLLAALTNEYKIFRLHERSDYQKLNNICEALLETWDLSACLLGCQSHTNGAVSFLQNYKLNSLLLLKQFNDDLEKLNKQFELIEITLKQDFIDNFAATKY